MTVYPDGFNEERGQYLTLALHITDIPTDDPTVFVYLIEIIDSTTNLLLYSINFIGASTYFFTQRTMTLSSIKTENLVFRFKVNCLILYVPFGKKRI
jgi:hypothetical protein